MLSWPAIFPVLLLVYIQVYQSKPSHESYFGPGDPSLFGIHAGTICAAFLVSLLLTWIIYRLSGRSRLASHAAFFALLLFFSVSIGWRGLLERRSQQRASETPNNVEPIPANLDFRREPMLIFDEKISVNFPAIASQIETNKPETQFAININNPVTSSTDFQGVLQLMELAPGETVEAACERLASGSKKEYKLLESFVWRPVKGPRKSLITQPVFVPGATDYIHVMWGIVQLDGRQILLINFSLFSHDATQRAEYAACAQKLVESIEINNHPKP